MFDIYEGGRRGGGEGRRAEGAVVQDIRLPPPVGLHRIRHCVR